MTLWYVLMLSFSLMALLVVFGMGYLWCKHLFRKNHIKIIQSKLEEFTKGSEVIFYENGSVKVYQEGEPLFIEDMEGDIGLFVLIRKFKKAGG